MRYFGDEKPVRTDHVDWYKSLPACNSFDFHCSEPVETAVFKISK